jgi:hypothetical protein
MPRWRAGVNYGYFWSELRFDGLYDFDIQRRGVTGTLELRLSPRTSLQLAGGAVFGGALEGYGQRYTLGPGWLAAAAFSWTVLDGKNDSPFVIFSASLGVSGAGTELQRPRLPDPPSVALVAVDGRFGLTVGKAFWQRVAPYVSVRAFGGPVFWEIAGEDYTGTDLNHYQVAAGITAFLPSGFDVYAELAPAGERAVAVGAGMAF